MQPYWSSPYGTPTGVHRTPPYWGPPHPPHWGPPHATLLGSTARHHTGVLHVHHTGVLQLPSYWSSPHATLLVSTARHPYWGPSHATPSGVLRTAPLLGSFAHYWDPVHAYLLAYSSRHPTGVSCTPLNWGSLHVTLLESSKRLTTVVIRKPALVGSSARHPTGVHIQPP